MNQPYCFVEPSHSVTEHTEFFKNVKFGSVCSAPLCDFLIISSVLIASSRIRALERISFFV